MARFTYEQSLARKMRSPWTNVKQEVNFKSMKGVNNWKETAADCKAYRTRRNKFAILIWNSPDADQISVVQGVHNIA